MKKREAAKTLFLGSLILLGIIQTMMLWLGGFSGQSFFHTTTVQVKGIEPSMLWFVKPSAGSSNIAASFAYKMDRTIDNVANEYDQLVKKLEEILSDKEVVLKNTTVQDYIDWEMLLTEPGIMYQYEVAVDLEEMSGTQDDKGIPAINNVYVYSDTNFNKAVNLAFISEKEQKVYTMKYEGAVDIFKVVYNFYTSDEVVGQMIKYQPSALSNIQKYMKGNAFMTIASEKNPIVYDLLKVYNPIDLTVEKGIKALEKCVTSFFFNPLLKDITYEEDGSVVFTEPTQSIVTYDTKGVLEYINLAAKSSTAPMSLASGYRQALTFIHNSDALATTIKDRLYLTSVIQRGDSYQYAFDLRYEGHPVVLSDAMRESLGINAFVEVTVKGNQVIAANLCMLQIIPSIENGVLQKGVLQSGYVEPINKMLEQLQDTSGTMQFEDMTTAYVMTDRNEYIYLKRGVAEGNRWYYP